MCAMQRFFVVLAAPFCDAYDLTLRWFVCVSTSHVRCDGLCIMRRMRCYGFVFERVLGFDPQTYLPLLRLRVLIVLRIFFSGAIDFFLSLDIPVNTSLRCAGFSILREGAMRMMIGVNKIVTHAYISPYPYCIVTHLTSSPPCRYDETTFKKGSQSIYNAME